MQRALKPILIVALLAAAVYANALPNGFVYDDWDLIVENPWLKEGRLMDAFRLGYWESTRGGSFYYRPIVSTVYWIDSRLWEESPLGYHLSNLLLHLAVSILALLLARRWLESPGAALAVAALFAVHPVHAQSVTWIAGRTDLIATLFFLGALLLHQHARETGRHEEGSGARLRGPLLEAAALVVLALALLSKEMAVTYPAVLILHFLFMGRSDRTGRYRLRRLAIPLLGSVAVVAAWLTLRHFMVGALAGYADDPHAWWNTADGTASRLLAVPLVLAFYLRRVLFPWWLGFESQITPLREAPGAGWIAAVIGLAALVVLAIRFRRRNAAVLLGLGWFAVTLLPVANIFPIFESAMEHFAYLPSLGLILAAVAVGRSLLTSPRAQAAACIVAVLLLGARTVSRNRDWVDEETFWTVTARETPSARAWNNLGLHLRDTGRLPEAAEALLLARTLAPHLPSSHSNLGAIAAARGRRDEAIDLFTRALSIDPRNADALYNLALVLETDATGRRYGPGFPAAEALDAYRRLVEAHPGHAEGWTNMGVLYERLRRPDDAVRSYEGAIRAAPSLPEPHLFLASLLWDRGDRPGAGELYRRYLELAPDGEHAAEARTRAAP